MIGRRRLIAVVGAAAAWPFAACAQGANRIPRLGVLWPNPPATFEFLRQGLTEHGYIDGENIRFEFRWAEEKLDQLPELARELVAIPVDVLVTLAPPATIAAKKATQRIPIVFIGIGEPVASGLVTSLARPGANLTGTTRMLPEVSAKHVQLLKEAVPSLSELVVLWNPINTSHRPALDAAKAVALSLSIELRPLEVKSAAELNGAFAVISREKPDGLLFIADPIFFIKLESIAEFTASTRLPGVANFVEFPKLGGLMGYAPSIREEFRHAAEHVDKILKGAKPAELPVEQPTKFELVINLKTAKALGITVPQTLLARADEVIE